MIIKIEELHNMTQYCRKIDNINNIVATSIFDSQTQFKMISGTFKEFYGKTEKTYQRQTMLNTLLQSVI